MGCKGSEVQILSPRPINFPASENFRGPVRGPIGTTMRALYEAKGNCRAGERRREGFFPFDAIALVSPAGERTIGLPSVRCERAWSQRSTTSWLQPIERVDTRVAFGKSPARLSRQRVGRLIPSRSHTALGRRIRSGEVSDIEPEDWLAESVMGPLQGPVALSVSLCRAPSERKGVFGTESGTNLGVGSPHAV